MPGILNHSPPDIVRHLLVGLEKGTLPTDELDWPIFAGQETDSPDNQIVTYDTSPMLDGRVQNSGEVQEHHGVLIQVRSATQTVGHQKITDIGIALDQEVLRSQVEITDPGLQTSVYTIQNASRRSGPLYLGTEPTSSRFLFTINYLVSIRLVS